MDIFEYTLTFQFTFSAEFFTNDLYTFYQMSLTNKMHYRYKKTKPSKCESSWVFFVGVRKVEMLRKELHIFERQRTRFMLMLLIIAGSSRRSSPLSRQSAGCCDKECQMSMGKSLAIDLSCAYTTENKFRRVLDEYDDVDAE